MKYIFSVEGMTDAKSENHVDDTVRAISEAFSVHSDRNTCQTVVLADGLNTNMVVSAIKKLGYNACFLPDSKAKPTYAAH